MWATTTLKSGESIEVRGTVRVVKVTMHRQGYEPPVPAVVLEYEDGKAGQPAAVLEYEDGKAGQPAAEATAKPPTVA